MKERIGFVAIARNEGERLRGCLRSLRAVSAQVVYVDSGSTDGSVEFARDSGVEVVELDLSRKFSMARARNAGWRELRRKWPELQLVQFVDGDCELLPGWLEAAMPFLEQHPEVVVVCGRRRERHPGRSIYNGLCEVEWNTPIGETRSCGGDALMRLAALEQVGGFDESLIAGEEPELCKRLREAGGVIWRLDVDMTRHDAAILAFSQWWRRSVRGGYGAADVATRTGDLFAGQVRSAVRWTGGSALGLLAAGILAITGRGWLGALLVAILGMSWGAQSGRIAWGIRGRCDSRAAAIRYGGFTLLAKLPQTLGILRYHRDRLASREARVIEYKG